MTVPMLDGVADLDDAGWDVVVVGAGPAGSLAARRLAQAGARVLLLERRRMPRDKACGDALIPDALACLARNGLLARVAARAWRTGHGTIHAPSGRPLRIRAEALTVRRELLDAELAAAAVEAGAVLAQGTVEHLLEGDGAGVVLHVRGRGRPVRARFAVVATGASTAVLGACGLLERAAPSAVAIRAYVTSDAPIEDLVVSFDRRIVPGYAWIFPMGGGVFNVGCGVVTGARGADDEGVLRRTLADFLERTTAGQQLAAGERARGRVRGAMIRFGLAGARPYSGGAVMAVGEAIGATFPLTGEGIGKSMETSEVASDLLVEALRAGTPAPLAAYPAELERRLRPKYRAYEVAQRWVGVPWLTDAVLRRAGRSARVRGAIEGVLTETVDPARVFSPLGLLRALFA